METEEFIKASLTLHNTVPVKEEFADDNHFNKNLAEYGYLVFGNLSGIVENVLIKSAVSLNRTFSHNWHKITSEGRSAWVIEQALHYLSVALADGCPELIYVPNDRKDHTVQIPFRYIKSLTIDQIKTATKELLTKRVALKEDTIKAIFSILKVEEIDISTVKNQDTKIHLFVKLGGKVIPNDPIEILKCALYDMTGELTLIKNKELYKIIKESTYSWIYVNRWFNGQEQILARIFNRFKPVFMAMKMGCQDKSRSTINRISKLSKRYHVPCDSIGATADLKDGFRLIKQIGYLTRNKQPKVYQIRNGKMWCTRDRKNNLDLCKENLRKLLPRYLFQSPHTRLTLPTSEKNFVGPFPIGTQFTADSLIIGIHWRNRDNIRVDLDLSAINKDGKIGWNSTCYNNDQSVVHSGDVIDATNGANEYLYFRKHLAEPHIVLVNNYNNVENVEMEVIIATASKVPNRNEIVSDGQVIATAKTFCDKNQKAIGVVYPSDDGPVFVLIDKCLGSVSNISTWNMDKQIIIDSLRDNYLFMDDYMRSSSTVPKISDRYAVNFSNNLLSKSDILNIFSSSKNE